MSDIAIDLFKYLCYDKSIANEFILAHAPNIAAIDRWQFRQDRELIMALIRRLRTVHLALAAGVLALISLGTLLVKIMLMRNFTPKMTYDTNGVFIMNGPYSYDNNVLDGISMNAMFAAIALVIIATLWRRLRPMM